MATLEQALETVGQLPPEQQDMLAEILRQRKNEAWRRTTAEEARQAVTALREGKLVPASSSEVISQLQTILTSDFRE